MLETIMNSYVIFWAMGVTAAIGLVGKLITMSTLKRLVRAAGNMGKSTHKLMKFVKAKFEHACMVNDRVENMSAFVEKYLCEYRVWGLRLHSWRYLQKQMMWLVGMLGIFGAAISFQKFGMQEIVFQYGVWAAVGMMVLFLLRNATDEEYQIAATEVYMIDYLENICAPRYEKHQVQEVQRMEKIIEEPVEEEVKEKHPTQEVLLREILEEFLA